MDWAGRKAGLQGRLNLALDRGKMAFRSPMRLVSEKYLHDARDRQVARGKAQLNAEK